MPKTILVHTEASYLSTGYAVYSHEILSRLHKTKKYNIVEYANYGSESDPRRNSLPWEFVGVLPLNDQEKQVYESVPTNQFGSYKFEQTLLKYKPDIVYSMLDIWMNEYQLTSPFRKCYSLFWMPTVDSEPQPMEWVSKYEQCDGIFTYTRWAEQHLRTLSKNIKYCGQASPAADYDVFRPMNSKEVFGFKDKFVIGTTMRNQKRKLFPNLVAAFDKLMDSDEKIRKVTYLYLHTSWPDNGWNIPEIIKNSKYSNRILMTYACHSCGSFYPSIYSDALSICKNCGNYTASTPNTTRGLDRKQLAAIYNVFDIYVQYSREEGFALPIAEAAACNIPVFGTDYSAMCSVIPDCGGNLIRLKEKHLDPDKNTYFAIPDDDDLIKQIKHYFHLPEHEKNRKRIQAREKAMKNYSYDKTVNNLIKYFDQAKDGNWNGPPDIRPAVQNVPNNLSYSQLVDWAIINILGKPELLGTYFSTKLLKELNQGCRFSNNPNANELSMIGIRSSNIPYGPNDMLNELAHMRTMINFWEERRIGVNNGS